MRSQWLLASLCVGLAGVFGVGCIGSSTPSGSGAHDGGVLPVGDSGLFTVPPPAEGGVPLGDASAGVEAATSAHPMAPNGYYVVGPTIYDSSNQPHLFHG